MLRPQKESVHLSRLNRPIYFNMLTLADEEWIQGQWSPSQLEVAFRTGDMDVILTLVWRMIDDESKRLVRDAKVVVWEGLEEKAMDFETPAKKLKYILSGKEEAEGILSALFKTQEKSRPKREEKEKKSLTDGSQSQTPGSST
jgi:hypothetical protein